MNRGDVYWHTFDWPYKHRPVVVLTRGTAIDCLTSITIAPLTTHIRDIPSEVELTPDDDGVPAHCAVNLDNTQTVAQDSLELRITSLADERMWEVDDAIAFALGMDRFF